jgi:hypothetical protein
MEEIKCKFHQITPNIFNEQTRQPTASTEGMNLKTMIYMKPLAATRLTIRKSQRPTIIKRGPAKTVILIADIGILLT